MVIKALANAASQWGYFVLVNHGIDFDLISKALEFSTKFFQLSEEEKRKFAAKKPFEEDGYGSKTNYSAGNAALWRDFLLLHTHPRRNADNWPDTPSDYKETMARIGDEMFGLSQQLFGLLSEGLGMPEEFLWDKLGEARQTLLTNYYPACKDAEKVIGIHPHTDYGALSLLIRNEVPGLQVLKDGVWFMPSQPIPNAIDVNIGDLIELITNGRYISVMHRVIVDPAMPRLSIGSNVSCHLEKIVSPAPELINDHHPRLFKSIKFADSIAEKAKSGNKIYMRI